MCALTAQCCIYVTDGNVRAKTDVVAMSHSEDQKVNIVKLRLKCRSNYISVVKFFTQKSKALVHDAM